MTPEQKHHIRNAISCYHGLRRRILKAMAEQLRAIQEIDKQMLRMETAIRGDYEPEAAKTPWYKKILKI